MNLEFLKSDDAIVGILKIRLVIRSAHTLKDKRRIIKSLKDRIKNKFNVSISEIGTVDHCQYARLGIAMVGNDKKYLNGTLLSLLNMFRAAVSVELVDHHLEFI
ncbi:MAG: DUF503 domain-containing protein [Candidatus Brocadia sp.]|jgi:uncharacterized protein YlxP (DUF503 family)|nr:hypothetical protein [Candidatus Brocadia fulgida]MCC6324064.1 DUF503 domain-containing protein [Candidatus Brocadia sp.]MCE7911769.1 DUF503 domain-containing protein [Candidatus Brocadia sp. AMX3]OQY99592.1 MAG: hypothetical protein B6D35_08770 [Candidatus Brocadia sp. UTAMX2]MDG5996521.1 DUF503 domain-containing protein [Candidatus Brocadia sp.]